MQRLRDFVRRHSTAVGIGLLAASALVAVLAVVLVIGMAPDEAADAPSTPSPISTSPSASASESEAPSPSASADATWDGYELTDVASPLFSSLWVRVTVDELNVRSRPDTDATVVGLLRSGDLARITGDETGGQPSWVPIVGDGVAGWVAIGDGQDAYIQPVATPWLFGSPRSLEGVAASGQQALAYGWGSDLQVQPYEGSGTQGLAYISTDGGTWEELAGPGGPDAPGLLGRAVAGGGDGFVLAAQPNYLGPTTVRISSDGLTWSEPALLDAIPRSAAWGPAGGVLLTESIGEVTAYLVRAGAADEVARLSEGSTATGIEASPQGYVIFGPYGSAGLLVSRDGRTWQTATVPGPGSDRHLVRDVELRGDRLIVVTTDAGSGRAVLHYGRLGSGATPIEWADATAAPFGSATVSSISAGAGALLALGWDQDELVPRVWRSEDGRSWTDLDVDPTTFGGAIGPEPAFAAGQWIAVSDAIYASPDGASWERVFQVPRPEPSTPGCPPADRVRALDLMFLGRAAADCYGDAPLTFTAWMPFVEGLGGCCWQIGTPQWLAAPIPPAFLSPGPGEQANNLVGSFGVYPSPTVDGEIQPESWAVITGHFHDAAAQECRHTPSASEPHQLESQAEVIAECERRFVVDRIVPTDGA